MRNELEQFKSQIGKDVYLIDFIELFKMRCYDTYCKIDNSKMESIFTVLNDMNNKMTMLYFELEKDILKINDIIEVIK